MSQQKRRGDSFHITVGATPATRGKISLDSELRLLKAALLYADEVKFCSLSSSFLITMLQIGQLSGEDLLQIFAQGMNNEELNRNLAIYLELKRKKHRSGKELLVLRKLKTHLDRLQVETRQYFENLALQASLDQLEVAFNTGLVEVKLFDGADSEALTQQYFDTVSTAVLSGDTYPLFDDLTGDMVRSAIREGKIVPSEIAVNRAKQVALSSDLLSKLPLFDDAPLGEIFDIRKELEKPLIRFRSGIIKFSRDVQSAAWDQEFPKEAEQVFREHVEPAVLEIEDACKSNKLLLKLVPNLVDKPIIPATGSALAVMLAQASELPALIAGGLGLVAGASTVVLRSIQEWREKNQEIESNQLYFYYKAGKLLTE